MKTELTKDDPTGWYGCRRPFQKKTSDVGYWTGKEFRTNMTKPVVVTGRMYKEEEVAELRQALAENEALVAESVKGAEQVNEELASLRAEVNRLKAQPYPMRKAEKPDCAGIWMDRESDVCGWTEDELSGTEDKYFIFGPYYYLGPIPQIPKEQQPPKVVRIRCKRTGSEVRAIPSLRDGKPEHYFPILEDGTISGISVWCNNWEEVIQ